MAYTSKTAAQLRNEPGSLLSKIASETALIDAELEAVASGAVTLANTKIFVGSVANVATAQTMSGDATIAANGALTIAAKAVELSMMNDLATGSIIVGGAANAPSALVAKTAGQILVGDGTDLKSVAVSGDATLAANGALTIAANAVGSTEIAAGYGKVVKVALVEGVENAISFAWQNPEATAIIVPRVMVHITTAGGTGGATMNVGKVANATSTASDIINAIDLASPTLISSSTCTAATVLDAKDGASDYITGKILGANAAALVGNVYIWYITV